MTADSTVDRIADCRAMLDGIGDQPVEQQTEILEHLHDALTQELDELLRRDQPSA